jgi:hypothetical protein
MKFIALLLLPIFSFAQTKLEQKISILDQRVELLVPKELVKITPEIWKIKYGNMQQPILSLSDKDVDVNLIGQFTNQKWDENNLAEYKDFRINNLKKTRTDVEILENGVKDINGKKVGFFKFMSQARDVKIFNYYFFTIVDEKIFLFNFNCSEASRNTWEKTADEIVASLKTK